MSKVKLTDESEPEIKKPSETEDQFIQRVIAAEHQRLMLFVLNHTKDSKWI